jgi:glycopeptide antibiotics resistance protein
MKFWKWWVLLIAIVSGPWFGIVREPQWSRVTWIPFTGPEDKPRDVVANFLMFVPFGMSFAARRRGTGATAQTLLAGLAISLAVEAPQLFYRLRDPSATDVMMAVCGSAAGSLAAQAFYGRDTRGAPGRREAGERRCEQE